ncbi:MAG: hypothetical protein RMK30_08895 [Anaerolineae bacterium]|nr:hypothetical protein [Anaerolineae bacterium]MDW8102979.1 hypothetical protein [Anaerolineae bacterium]
MNSVRSIRITPFSSIEVERRLPIPGEVLVRPGESVEPSRTIAVAELHGWVCLDVARELGVKENELERFLKKRPGDRVEAGEEIASRKGLLPFTFVSYTSPVSGKVAATGMGVVILETTSGSIELKAGLKGLVSRIIPYYGAIIESRGALIEGIWSNGKERDGILKIVGSREKPLLPENLQASARGFIVVCGTIQDEETLSRAAALQVSGIVTGSLKASLIERALAMPYPVILTEGFGQIPMNLPAFELLHSSEGYEVSILATPPSIFISVPGEIIAPSFRARKEGSPKVKVSRGPYRGLFGEVLESGRREMVLESGYIVPSALVRLENGLEIEVPLVNLETIEF